MKIRRLRRLAIEVYYRRRKKKHARILTAMFRQGPWFAHLRTAPTGKEFWNRFEGWYDEGSLLGDSPLWWTSQRWDIRLWQAPQPLWWTRIQ